MTPLVFIYLSLTTAELNQVLDPTPTLESERKRFIPHAKKNAHAMVELLIQKKASSGYTGMILTEEHVDPNLVQLMKKKQTILGSLGLGFLVAGVTGIGFMLIPFPFPPQESILPAICAGGVIGGVASCMVSAINWSFLPVFSFAHLFKEVEEKFWEVLEKRRLAVPKNKKARILWLEAHARQEMTVSSLPYFPGGLVQEVERLRRLLQQIKRTLLLEQNSDPSKITLLEEALKKLPFTSRFYRWNHFHTWKTEAMAILNALHQELPKLFIYLGEDPALLKIPLPPLWHVKVGKREYPYIQFGHIGIKQVLDELAVPFLYDLSLTAEEHRATLQLGIDLKEEWELRPSEYLSGLVNLTFSIRFLFPSQEGEETKEWKIPFQVMTRERSVDAILMSKDWIAPFEQALQNFIPSIQEALQNIPLRTALKNTPLSSDCGAALVQMGQQKMGMQSDEPPISLKLSSK